MSNRHPKYPVVLSILAAVVTAGLKYLAYYRTGSVGFLSDAAESAVNLLAAVTALLCLWYASRPVDPSHTYGHEKIEFFSSGLEGVLILVAAAGIAWAGVERLLSPQKLHSLDEGMLWCGAAAVLNLAVAQLLLRVGKSCESIVLEADGRHLMTDVWTSVGVIVGEGLVLLTDIQILDPLLALLVAGNITWTGMGLVLRSFNGLMDHALPAEEQARLRAAIEKCLQPGMTYHALRTRQAGAHRFVDFHLLVPGQLSVQAAHAVANQMEEALRACADLEVTIHIEPIEEPDAWHDSALLELELAERLKEQEKNRSEI